MTHYRHSKHAGNSADCHKHLLLNYLLTTHRPAQYLETHAGAGCYRLSDTGSWTQGIGRLWPVAASAFCPEFSEGLTALNPEPLTLYPGSPWWAHRILGAEPLTLFELELDVADQLREVLADADVRSGDGFSSVAHLLEEGSFTLVDPPYVDPYEFERALNLLTLVAQRGDCALMLWYPRFADQREADFLQQLEVLLGDQGWRSDLLFETPVGVLVGSGVAVVGLPPLSGAAAEALADALSPIGRVLTG